MLTGESPPHERALYWRYKANDQAAVRDGNWKYLRLGGREHLFDLAADPRERAELRDAHPQEFERLKRCTTRGTRRCRRIRPTRAATT